MFHPHFFHPGLHSHHCHDVLADAMALAAAFKVEMDSQRKWQEERERERRIDSDRVLEHGNERRWR